jgi:putative Mg2+ transporter-C (MgtC) family protein
MNDSYFGLHVDPTALWGKAIALLLAAFLSTIIGLERQRQGAGAGMRTHILVCVGAALITMSSIELSRLGVAEGLGKGGDPGRLAAQIVSGIGFLGAGAIVRSGLTVHGLTTAASVWTIAGIGIAVGISPRTGELATVATGIVLVTLSVLERLEYKFHLKVPFVWLEIHIENRDDCLERVLDKLTAQGVSILEFSSEVAGSTRIVRIRLTLSSKMAKREAFIPLLTNEEGVIKLRME